jgi:hypothetical protein
MPAGYTAVGSAANGGTIAAPAAEGAAVAGEGGILGTVAPAAAIAIGAYTAKKAYDGFKAGEGKGFSGGAKAGFKSAGPLAFVPVLGQAPVLGGILGGMFGQKSTRDIAKERTAELMAVGKEDPIYQKYVAGMRRQFDAPPPDSSKPYAGKYGTFNEYKAAGLQANDLTGVYGNIKAFGPKWASLTQEQRVAVTQGIIDAGLYDSKKGDVIITDEDRAKKIYEGIVGAKPAATDPKRSRPQQQQQQSKPVQRPTFGQSTAQKVGPMKAGRPGNFVLQGG